MDYEDYEDYERLQHWFVSGHCQAPAKTIPANVGPYLSVHSRTCSGLRERPRIAVIRIGAARKDHRPGECSDAHLQSLPGALNKTCRCRGCATRAPVAAPARMWSCTEMRIIDARPLAQHTAAVTTGTAAARSRAPSGPRLSVSGAPSTRRCAVGHSRTPWGWLLCANQSGRPMR